MPPIDYMKVLDIAAQALGTSSHVEVNSLDLKIFNAVIRQDDKSELNILLTVNDYDLELNIDNIFSSKKEFQKWLSRFEFLLEQNFFKNISLVHSGSSQKYKIKVLF